MKDSNLDLQQRQKDDVIFSNNQRRAPRIDAELEVTLTGPHNFFNGFTENISNGGLFIATRQTFDIGTEFKINMKLENETIEFVAKVAWIRSEDSSSDASIEPGMGLQFVNLSEKDKVIIDKFLKKKEPLFFDTDL